HARRRISPAIFESSAQVFPPLLRQRKSVRYIELGVPSARAFWENIVLPNYEQLNKDPCPASVFNAAQAAWHMKDWIWHDQHRGEETRNNKEHVAFEAKLFDDCPELAWIRDVADGSKHCGLTRDSVTVRELGNAWPRAITLDDGTKLD